MGDFTSFCCFLLPRHGIPSMFRCEVVTVTENGSSSIGIDVSQGESTVCGMKLGKNRVHFV